MKVIVWNEEEGNEIELKAKGYLKNDENKCEGNTNVNDCNEIN
jgi:hypothetical protein